MTVGLEVGLYSRSRRTSMQNLEAAKHGKVFLAESMNQEFDAAAGV